MLDRILAFLKDIPGAHAERPGADDPRIAAVALLFHIVNADGIRGEQEVKRLRGIVSETYGISGSELERVVRDAEEADREAIDLYSFTSVLNRHLSHEVKRELVEIMWAMVFADGELHELEDNIVWRVSELIGVERDERVALRRQARATTGEHS